MFLASGIIKRLAAIISTLFVVSILVFILQHLLPGDPALALAGEESDPVAVEALRKKLGLDQPLLVQYLSWIGNVLQGDMGVSVRNQIPVLELITTKLPVTLQLAFWSMLVGLVIGIPAGVISAVYKDRTPDYIANFVAISGISVPNFWLAIMLILLFSVQLGWLPASGYVSPFVDLRQNLVGLILPAIVLGTGVAGVMMRHTRGSMLEVLQADYIRTARAKGLGERKIVIKHALRNALLPIITLGAIEFGHLLAGAVLTEQIFAIPGFGKLIVDGVFNRDYAVVQGVVLFTAFLYVLLNSAADVLYTVANPRMRG